MGTPGHHPFKWTSTNHPAMGVPPWPTPLRFTIASGLVSWRDVGAPVTGRGTSSPEMMAFYHGFFTTTSKGACKCSCIVGVTRYFSNCLGATGCHCRNMAGTVWGWSRVCRSANGKAPWQGRRDADLGHGTSEPETTQLRSSGNSWGCGWHQLMDETIWNPWF